MNKIRKILANLAIAAAAAAVVIVAMLALSGTFRTGKIPPKTVESRAQLPPIKPFLVEKTAHLRVVDVVGSVAAEIRTTITARIIANIMEMKVAAGDKVDTGEVLVVLDDREPRARLG